MRERRTNVRKRRTADRGGEAGAEDATVHTQPETPRTGHTERSAAKPETIENAVVADALKKVARI